MLWFNEVHDAHLPWNWVNKIRDYSVSVGRFKEFTLAEAIISKVPIRSICNDLSAISFWVSPFDTNRKHSLRDWLKKWTIPTHPYLVFGVTNPHFFVTVIGIDSCILTLHDNIGRCKSAYGGLSTFSHTIQEVSLRSPKFVHFLMRKAKPITISIWTLFR